MNDHFIRIAHMLGPLVLTGNRASDIAHAMKLRRLFSALSIDTVIDVGANQGQFRNFLRNRVGFKGQIISFEPVPELAEALKAKAASDGRWLVHPFALGAMSGQATINVMAHTEFSSIRNPIRSTSEDMDRKNTVTRTVSVPIKTLDSVFPENQDFSHTYLKLDTQ